MQNCDLSQNNMAMSGEKSHLELLVAEPLLSALRHQRVFRFRRTVFWSLAKMPDEFLKH
jgi:hypothetical protein